MDWEPQPVGRSQLSLMTFRDSHSYPPLREGGCWPASSTTLSPSGGPLRLRSGLRLWPSELLMDPFLVLVGLQLEFLSGDLAILVAVLVLKHVSYGFVRVLPGHEAPFAFIHLSIDEGGELGEGTRGTENKAVRINVNGCGWGLGKGPQAESNSVSPGLVPREFRPEMDGVSEGPRRVRTGCAVCRRGREAGSSAEGE